MNATILGQAIAFVLFVWFCMKYVWPPLMAAIEKRQKEIADGLAVGAEPECRRSLYRQKMVSQR
jgi:ATP synthase F0 subunit b